MPELTLISTLYYRLNSLYYIVRGDRLIQFDKNYYLEFEPGNELYGFLMRRFKKMAPIPQSEGSAIFKELIQRLNEITE